ncbi:TPA: hypothetical protein N0F65_002020 [Lagenidium giganteum]|uniref:Kinesin n=1 Tax=Lagenidium giganteum TaxID=4803 RepID=A0AAV2Z2N3_9STRA|nr:TPA: hypothetical protein N0F65_002020 [Lagenidium giganteum]
MHIRARLVLRRMVFRRWHTWKHALLTEQAHEQLAACVTIQSWMRFVLVRLRARMFRINRGLAYFQARWRGFYSRRMLVRERRFHRYVAAVRCVERAYQAYTARCRFVFHFERLKASMIITRRVRGYCKRLRMFRAWLHKLARFHAAVVIQLWYRRTMRRIWRRRAVRDRIVHSAHVVFRFFRYAYFCVVFLRRVESALQHKAAAATTLQRVYRAKRARERFHALKDALEAQKRAQVLRMMWDNAYAMRIQQAWRHKKLRQRPMTAETKAGIRVCARFRPQNKLEKKQQAVDVVRVEDGSTVHIDRGGGDNITFTFDQIFGVNSTQRQVYEATAKPLVESALLGYNCTCFVYGQTGTGKTFSMEGVPGDAEYEGIIPRVMNDIFDGIQNMQAELEFLVRVSYIEIYLEKIRDLLEPSSSNLSVRESKERGVWVAGATEVCCASADEMMAVMRLGGANRVISSTRMNNDSSRSHSVFIITIEQRNVATGSTRSGKLFLVDLAGSEKVGKTHAKGQTLKEAQHINKSLSALGSVMNALTSGQSGAHIPYRDSKLTRLLQDSLGGNSETTLLVCGSCSSYNSEETISTLRFGSRAKSIKNKPKVNEERTVAEYKQLLAEKEKEIKALQEQLVRANGGAAATETPTPAADVQKFQERIEQLEDELASKAAEVSSLEARCVELGEKSDTLRSKEVEFEAMAQKNAELERRLAFMEQELQLRNEECAQFKANLLKRQNSQSTSPRSAGEASSSGDNKQLDNELLVQQLQAKQNELAMCTKRMKEMADEIVNCRSFYERQIEILQEKLHEYDSHVLGFMDIAEKEDKAAQLDSLMQKTKTLRSVRGGGAHTALTARTHSVVAAPAEGDPSAASANRDRPRHASAPSTTPDGWTLDTEVYPIAPIDMESPVVKRLIANMPEKGREKMAKWLTFVLEGRDIRSNFHPEISIEGIHDEVNSDMRRLIVPLLKNRRDLDVQSFIRTRFVRVSDLKISLVHRHRDTVNVDADSSQGTDPTGSNRAAISSSKTPWAKDHAFYGPKGDPSSPLVLHGAREMHATKDRFVSEPVELSASMNEAKSILDAPGSGGSATSAPAAPVSGSGVSGMFGKLRKSAGVTTVLGNVKSLVSSQYHKYHVHDDTLCDGCGMSPIVGAKWKCSSCESVDLCDGCYGAGIHGFEVSNAMCRRIEQLAVYKHRLLADYPELFELFRTHLCHDDVVSFRRIVEWLGDIASGNNAANIHHKSIVKNGLHPEIRARLVAQLGALASERPNLVLKTEWFIERGDDEPEPVEGAEADQPSKDGEVRLETLRMYVTSASSPSSDSSARNHSFADLLQPKTSLSSSGSVRDSGAASANGSPTSLKPVRPPEITHNVAHPKGVKSVATVEF